MFFAPTLLSLKEKNDVMVLCLSSGNEKGLGEVRRKELVKSCQVLGIDEFLVDVEEHPSLQDNPSEIWNSDVIFNILKEYIEKNSIDTIITFDDRGISGHLNHISAFNGAKKFMEFYSKTTSDIHIYVLKTVNIIRKYISLFDLPWTYYKHHYSLHLVHQNLRNHASGNRNKEWKSKYLLFVSSPDSVNQARTAMKCHKSQLVWFRYLYVFFSRYMLINELEKI